MDEHRYYKLTILIEDSMSLIEVVVKTKEEFEHPMEPGNRDQIKKLLPLHVRTAGPIVAVDEIFCVVDTTQE